MGTREEFQDAIQKLDDSKERYAALSEAVERLSYLRVISIQSRKCVEQEFMKAAVELDTNLVDSGGVRLSSFKITQFLA